MHWLQSETREYLVQYSQMEDITSGLKTYKKSTERNPTIRNPMHYFRVYLGWRVEQLETG